MGLAQLDRRRDVGTAAALAVLVAAAGFARAETFDLRAAGVEFEVTARGMPADEARLRAEEALLAVESTPTGKKLIRRWRRAAPKQRLSLTLAKGGRGANDGAWLDGKAYLLRRGVETTTAAAAILAHEWLGHGLIERELETDLDTELVSRVRGHRVLLELDPDAARQNSDLMDLVRLGPWDYLAVLRHPSNVYFLAPRLADLADPARFFTDRAAWARAEGAEAEAKAASAGLKKPERRRWKRQASLAANRRAQAAWDAEIDAFCAFGRAELGLEGDCGSVATPFRLGASLDAEARERLKTALRRLAASPRGRQLVGRWAALGGPSITLESGAPEDLLRVLADAVEVRANELAKKG